MFDHNPDSPKLAFAIFGIVMVLILLVAFLLDGRTM